MHPRQTLLYKAFGLTRTGGSKCSDVTARCNARRIQRTSLQYSISSAAQVASPPNLGSTSEQLNPEVSTNAGEISRDPRLHRHPAQGHHAGRIHIPVSLKQKLRALLRNTAQPVAVVTSFMPKAMTNVEDVPPCFHGATLSSFTSISMDPHPLVAFALRIPSRMASALTSLASHLPPSQGTTPGSIKPFEHRNHTPTSHMVINLLSHTQADIAHQFSRPDLFPHPFSSTPYSLTKEGLPVLDGSLGAISCTLVRQPLKLSELGAGGEESEATDDLTPVVSELFIAKVVRVEAMKDGSDQPLLPLLYHRQKYTSC